MSCTVILALGAGNLNSGFPLVTAELKQQGKTVNKYSASLPPAPQIADLQNKWQASCVAGQYNRSGTRIKVKATGITNISEDNPEAIYQGLQAEMKNWLAAGEFFSKIEMGLRTDIATRSECVQIFLECESHLWLLPWNAWQFREEYYNSEITGSCREYKKVPLQATPGGRPLASRGRILCVSGNSTGIDVEQDAQEIQNYLGDRCELEFLKEPTPEEFHDRLFDEKGWQIFFFAGHSDSDDRGANIKLYINHNHQNNSVTLDYLREGIKRAIFRGLQLLIFNSCSSMGMAVDLVADGLPLPSIIVMRAPIPDPIAQDFVKSLLKYLAKEEPLFLAVRKAKDELQRWDKEFPGASSIPMLCQQPNFEEFTLPKRRENRHSNTAEITAIEPAGDRPKNPVFVSLSRLILSLAIGLLVSAIGYILMGPKVAPIANELGTKNAKENQPLIAKSYYKLATLLNPNYAAPHYNLAELCNKLNDSQCALQAMQNAVWRGLPEAYAQSSKTFILQNKHQEALKAIALCLENTKYYGVKASCFKNRGWVRLEQKQYDEAETDLRTAIAFSEDSPEAQCLLAKVLEIKGQPQAALKHWEKTLKHSNSSIPKQDECIQIARQRLQVKGNKP
ncbi:MAG: CHAT domain-containing protein [Oscillatoriaceae cyanobacterium Prado104]|jgi:tetratricopeptide (TPR) repeat protein|nr:CHAT domain-containing protein [Oscillatoriaceae cyanobacterium Prado104]